MEFLTFIKSYDPKQEPKQIFIHKKTVWLSLSKFLQMGGFKWIDPKEPYLNKYNSNSSKGCILEFAPEYSKALHDLDTGYHLAPDKIEIKEKRCLVIS